MRKPSAFSFGDGEAVRQRGSAGSREQAGECAVSGRALPQNIPSRNVANSGAFTNEKTNCSTSMMLL